MADKSDIYLQEVLKACRGAFVYALIFSFFTNLLMLTIPLYMLQIYDRVFVSYSYETLFYLTFIALGALITYILLEAIKAVIFKSVATWIEYKLSGEVLKKIPDHYLAGKKFAIQSVSDLQNLKDFLSGTSFIGLFDIPWMPIYLIVIFLLQTALGLLAVFGSLILIAIAYLNQRLTDNLLTELNGKKILSRQNTESYMHNAEVIQAMGMMPSLVHYWKEKNNEILKLQNSAHSINGVLSSFSKFTRLAIQLLTFTLGAYLVLGNSLTPGSMIAASILIGRALAPLDHTIASWKPLISSLAAYQRLKDHLANSPREETEISLPTPRGKIELEKLVYKLKGSTRPIINKVNLICEPGMAVALIGPSGAGKSTLARLILGVLKPTRGHARLDGADVFTWNREEFGKFVGYLPQDAALFNGSVKENIARMGPIVDEEIIAAAKLASVHELILHFPKGYDTPLGLGAFNLSNGQRQRIALARALYNKPKLLVLDEPNSNLDNEGEAALFNALLVMKKLGTTQLIITHRSELLQLVDKIIFLQSGDIKLYGARDEVIKSLQAAKPSSKG